MSITLIAAVGNNYELGLNNDLLWHLPDDFKWFVQQTKGKAVIMGRKTMESLGKPLKGRLNIVISRQNINHEGFIGVSSIQEAIKEAAKFSEEIMVIGGGEIYKQTIDIADKLLITRVNSVFPRADVFFPNIDENWRVVNDEYHPMDEKHKFDFNFITYIKKPLK